MPSMGLNAASRVKLRRTLHSNIVGCRKNSASEGSGVSGAFGGVQKAFMTLNPPALKYKISSG